MTSGMNDDKDEDEALSSENCDQKFLKMSVDSELVKPPDYTAAFKYNRHTGVLYDRPPPFSSLQLAHLMSCINLQCKSEQLRSMAWHSCFQLTEMSVMVAKAHVLLRAYEHTEAQEYLEELGYLNADHCTEIVGRCARVRENCAELDRQTRMLCSSSNLQPNGWSLSGMMSSYSYGVLQVSDRMLCAVIGAASGCLATVALCALCIIRKR